MKFKLQRISGHILTAAFIIVLFGSASGIASAQSTTNSSTKSDGGGGTPSCYTIKLSLLKDGVVSSDFKVKASQLSHYQLSMNILTSDQPMDEFGNPCPSGTYTLKYDIYDDATGSHVSPVQTGYFGQDIRVSDHDFGKAYSFSNPTLVRYVYTLTWTGGIRPPLSVTINVTYTDDKGNINPGSTNINTNTGGATNTNTNPSTPNVNINTSVGASINGSLDDNLGTFSNPLSKNTLPEILASILRILFALIGIVAVIIIIIAGFRMVLASGNEEALTKAKKSITWAIIGLIVSLMAFSIVAIIQRLIQG